ncbi:MAG: DUF1698 domain-containing protein, partial [Cellvibrionales bacterium]|nr:DUF1698 domain-containing protein [Cellvibrionales bacterium]
MHPPTSALYHRLGYAHLAAWMQANGLEQWAQALPGQIARGINAHRYGDLPKWLAALQALPNLRAETIDLATGVTLAAQNVTPQDRRQLETALKTLSPWRKGPYDLFGVKIDAEWRSDWKWQRLLPHIAPLKDRLILDVGCGNGYHLWRALGSGAHRAIGIDP